MKWLAALLIMLLSLLTGQCFVDRMGRRRKLLDHLLGFIRRMSAQISYTLMPPDSIIRSCDEGEEGFFHICAVQLDKGVVVEQAWARAEDECVEVRALKSEERRLLHELGRELGKYDAQLQLSVLNGFSEQLELFCRTAAAEHSEQSRLYTVCTLLAGALLSILII